MLNDAAQHYQQALQLFPSSAIDDLGVTHHHQLGYIFGEVRDIDRALQHYQQSIRYKEQAGNIFAAGETRFNVAIDLLLAARHDDARAYAEAALANFRKFGDCAAAQIQRAEQLIADIDKVGGRTAGKA